MESFEASEGDQVRVETSSRENSKEDLREVDDSKLEHDSKRIIMRIEEDEDEETNKEVR